MKYFLTLLILTFYLTASQGQSTDPMQKDPAIPFVLGEIHEIYSTALGEKRSLNIYLPEGYSASNSQKYPVIYLLDGSADEDFIHIVGLVQYGSFEWVNFVPGSIVVGIANVDRKRDFTFPTTIEADKKSYPTTGHSGAFIAFIETELQPFIEKSFKTTPSKTIIGQSLGGLLATEILLRKPTLFNRYVIVSPSLWWDNGTLLKEDSGIFQETFSQQTDIYIGVGKEGLTPTAIPRVMEVDANVLADKLRQSKSPRVKVIFDYLPMEDHASIMHQAVFNAFRLFHRQSNEPGIR